VSLKSIELIGRLSNWVILNHSLSKYCLIFEFIYKIDL
jgi:hypothetical protein